MNKSFLTVLLIYSQSIFACFAPPQYDKELVNKYINHSEYAFIGEPISVNPSGKHKVTIQTGSKVRPKKIINYDVQEVKYRVVKLVKGEVPSILTEKNLVMSSMCAFGVSPRLGKTYFVAVVFDKNNPKIKWASPISLNQIDSNVLDYKFGQ